MLNRYNKIAKSRVFDSTTDAEFTNSIRGIEHLYGVSPIGNMTERQRNDLEHRLVNNYEKSLAKIYECYDNLLGSNIPPFNVMNFHSVIAKVENDEHAKNILLILLGVNSFYGIVPDNTLIERQGVRHFISRYDYISDLDTSNCCVLI